MVSALESEHLAMFFDEDFSAFTYVDALFQSITGTSDKYSKSNLAKLSARLLDLMTHLDYHTNEIAKELQLKVTLLRNLSVSIVSGAGLDDTNVDETTRLKYYIDSLKTAVEALQSDVETARKQLDPQKISDNDPVETLIQLKAVRVNIGKVLHILQNARRMAGATDKQAIGVEEFQESLNVLQDTIKNQLKDGSENDKTEIRNTVEEMRSWTPMFQQFSQFGPVYVKFMMKLEAEV